jgi:N,N'-diacetyllegionaminate synthase
MIEIIAEIGVNHNGNADVAADMIGAAAACGCNTVKFQLWNTERVYPRDRWDEMKRLELSRDNIVSLMAVAKKHNVKFLCTPDDIEDAQFLHEIGVERIKIGSSNITNMPLLKVVAAFTRPVIISTGACSLDEMVCAVDYMRRRTHVTVMHCTSCYPPPLEEMNLRMIISLQTLFFGCPVGLSDHSGIGPSLASIMALGMGARTFETHFTLDSNQEGPDHKSSLDMPRMKMYVEALRFGALALGDGYKRIMPCERKNRAEYERFVDQQSVSC